MVPNRLAEENLDTYMGQVPKGSSFFLHAKLQNISWEHPQRGRLYRTVVNVEFDQKTHPDCLIVPELRHRLSVMGLGRTSNSSLPACKR